MFYYVNFKGAFIGKERLIPNSHFGGGGGQERLLERGIHLIDHFYANATQAVFKSS